MPTRSPKRPLTMKQECFCLAYCEGISASDAYRRCYNHENCKPASVNRKATELMDNVKITARIDELKAQNVKRMNITVESLTEDLQRVLNQAEDLGQPSAGVSAIMSIAKLHGLEVTKTKNETVGTIEVITGIDYDE